MPSEKVTRLLKDLDCGDLYEFLKLDRSASPADLRAAAENEWNRIHSKGLRGGRWDARKELAGECKSIFRDDTSKRDYDRELEKAAARSKIDDGVGSSHESASEADRQPQPSVNRRQADSPERQRVPMVHCGTCWREIPASALTCPYCGVPIVVPPPAGSARSRGVAAVLCIVGLFSLFLTAPVAGLHRFYVGKVGTGLLMLLSGGGFGVWTVIDLVLILVGRFRDRDGSRVLVWSRKLGFPGFEFFGSLGWSPRLRWVPLLLLAVFGAALLLDSVTGTREQLTGEPPPQSTPPLEGNGESALLEAEVALGLDGSARRRIQSGLAIAGFDPGPVDGVFGSRTRAAIRQWQSQVGVSPTGFLTATGAQLLDALARTVAESPPIGPRADSARGSASGDADLVAAPVGEELTVPPGGTTSLDSVASVPAPALGLAGRWFGRIEGFGRRYYVDVVFEEDGARIRYPLSGCSGRLHPVSGSSYREELAQGDECPANGRVTLRRLTAERVSYEWGYDSRSVEASGQLLGVAAMAEGGDASALSGIWSGEYGYTRYPSNEYSAELTMEPPSVVLRISWPCVFRLELVSADSQRLVYSSALLEGFCLDDGRLTLRRLGRDALWFETARVEGYGTKVGILHRGFE